ncbi:hypothetical protein D3C72_1311830 [compost metagenome]
MHHGAAGKVERAVLGQQATAPHHVRHGDVTEGEPQHREQENGRELDALGKCTHDQRHGDGRKGGLERDEHKLRNGCQRRRQGVRLDASEEGLVEAAKEVAFSRKGERVAVHRPQHRDQRKDHEHLRQHRQHVLAAHQAAVEQRQARDHHQDHQHGGCQHPRRIAAVECRRRIGCHGAASGNRRCRCPCQRK